MLILLLLDNLSDQSQTFKEIVFTTILGENFEHTDDTVILLVDQVME